MAQYGEASVDLWAAHSAILTLTQVPLRETATQLWAKIQVRTSLFTLTNWI